MKDGILSAKEKGGILPFLLYAFARRAALIEGEFPF
jgi:hypothetical protein